MTAEELLPILREEVGALRGERMRLREEVAVLRAQVLRAIRYSFEAADDRHSDDGEIAYAVEDVLKRLGEKQTPRTEPKP